MRALLILAMLLPAPALAQALYDEHPVTGSGDNGSTRINGRIGASITRKATPVQSPTVQPASSGIHVFQPRSLNDVAKDWAKAHPNDLPNRRKPDPQ